jgi:hypothetical protein
MDTYFGPMIYRVPSNYENLSFYPSPNELKNKILLKSTGNLS